VNALALINLLLFILLLLPRSLYYLLYHRQRFVACFGGHTLQRNGWRNTSRYSRFLTVTRPRWLPSLEQRWWWYEWHWARPHPQTLQTSAYPCNINTQNTVREIHVQIYLHFWPDTVMREFNTAESGGRIFQPLFYLPLTHGHKKCYWMLRFALECLLSQLFNGLLTQCRNYITSLTLCSEKLSWLCPTIKGSNSLETLLKSVSYEIFKQCLLGLPLETKPTGSRLLFSTKQKKMFI
jgi:hypothetical protein